MLKIAIISINQPSLNSAIKLNSYLDDYEVDIYGKKDLQSDFDKLICYEKIDSVLENGWKKYDAIICILAMGIVVRKIAPLLESKATDPAVLVMSMDLSKVIPLLSGHIGGANELSDVIAKKIDGCINFISTATDQVKVFAFDIFAKRNGMKIENLNKLANISNRLINKQKVKIFTYKNIFEAIDDKNNLHLISVDEIDENTVIINPLKSSDKLQLKPKIYLGMGCNRNTSFEDIEKAFLYFLDKYNLDLEQIENIASFEAKNDEVGLLTFAKKYNFDIKFFDEKQINALEGEFSPSQAKKFFGLKGVAEPSSVLVSKYKELIIPKEVYEKKITIAGAV
ncbi:cobalt-precorrin 5A hydrolase [Arcobacter sp. F2176]|uniref:cobalt-precorrin 5A hydrolase n=1 Tax=Arcobacter sp. F2176 TaxID=2044511 RepID=UPI00100B1260|nr:cobalamin biosynthesis protein [Arcobacter sp. F2176]RXJ81142.1 cobalamin biosynthesis protein CbiG [Arcobacter sp. F2176]